LIFSFAFIFHFLALLAIIFFISFYLISPLHSYIFIEAITPLQLPFRRQPFQIYFAGQMPPLLLAADSQPFVSRRYLLTHIFRQRLKPTLSG